MPRRVSRSAWQIDEMLKDEPWERVARFAARCCQSRMLNLPPWDLPPCSVSEDDDSESDAEAVKLLRKMLAAGVSRYAPDPMAAIEAAKPKGAA